MRTQMFGLSLAVSALVGCGGGGGSKGPDAKIFLDAPIDSAPACGVMASLGGLTLGTMAMPALGTANSPWFSTYTQGPMMGRTYLDIGGRLPSSTAALIDLLLIEVVKPTAGGFQLNTALNFETNGTATTYTAAAYVIGDVDSATNMFQNFYQASSGSITVTMLNEGAGGDTAGSVTATNYREIDAMTGADVPGGCTTGLTGLNFYLRNAAAFQPQQDVPAPASGGLQPMTAEEYKIARAAVDRFKQQRQQSN